MQGFGPHLVYDAYAPSDLGVLLIVRERTVLAREHGLEVTR